MRIYKRGLSWYLDVELEGRRVRKKVLGARTRTEAQAALAAVKTNILRGQFNFKSEKKIIFEDFADLYLERYSKPNKRSWRRDVTSIKALLPQFKGIPLSKITLFLIEGYKLKRKNEVEVSTINRELALLKHMFTKALDWGFASENPTKRVKLYNEENRKRWRILTSEETTALLENAHLPLKEFILIALNTGMRMGEIMALRWDDITEEYIFIRDSKSGRSRKVPINEVAREALKSLRDRVGAHDFVFPGRKAGTHEQTPRTAFENACRKAGISGLRIHDLRHQAASAMVQAGVDLHTVSKILGHSTIKLTERYSHPDFDHTKEAVQRLECLFGKYGREQKNNGTRMAQEESLTVVKCGIKMNSRFDRADS